MLKLEDLFYGSDLVANVFKKSLLKIGQFSTDYIFSVSDLNALHGEVFQRLIDPLMQFSDCKIRIKDFNKLSFNYIFLLKEASLRGCMRFLDARRKREEADDNNESLPHMEMPEIGITRATLEKYVEEIDRDNYVKVLEFVKRNAKLDSATIMKMVDAGVTKQHPFIHNKINILTSEMLNRYVPNWHPYLQKLIDKAFEEVASEKEARERKREELGLILETGKSYMKGKAIPKLMELRQRLLLDLSAAGKAEVAKEDVDKFLLNKNEFQIFQVTKKAVDKKFYGTFEGEAYHIDISDFPNIKITENSEDVFTLNEKKINFLRSKLKTMISPEISVEMKSKYENYNNVYVLYKKKRTEIFDTIIEQRDPEGLKLILAILDLDIKDPLVKTYYAPVEKLQSSIEQVKIDEMLLDFVQSQKDNVGFFAKLFGMFFSSSKENDLKNSVLKEKTKIAAVTKSLTSVSFSDSLANHQTPVQSAIGILKAANHDDDIRDILRMSIDNSEKVARILKLSQDIGNTNKAYIGKSEKTKAEFLEELSKEF
ncbi:MAG: hypothetical protein IKA37_07195 [Spirochaetales bacterium]|nr:hypothetical protein [Spirochaetales bacterium]